MYLVQIQIGQHFESAILKLNTQMELDHNLIIRKKSEEQESGALDRIYYDCSL